MQYVRERGPVRAASVCYNKNQAKACVEKGHSRWLPGWADSRAYIVLFTVYIP